MTTVTDIDFRRIRGPESKVLLKMLGVFGRAVPKTLSERIAKLKEIQKTHPEKFEVAFDVVIRKKLDAQQDTQEAPVDIESLAEQLLRKVSDKSQTLVSSISSLAFEDVRKEALALIQNAMHSYRPVEIVQPGGKRKKLTGKLVLPDEFDRMLQLASQRVNIMMVGPAGCGKTFLAGKVAEALGLDFSSISCSAGMSESQLAGWLLPVGNSGKFEYVMSEFVRIYENGGVFLLDEIDSSDSNALTFINQAIANEGFYIPQRYKKPYVKRHANFVCIAAANTYGQGADAVYVGRNQLDGATLDRFRAGMITMDYSKKVESALVYPEVLQWGLAIREVIRSNRLRRVMSTRVMLDLTKMHEAYKWGIDEWDKTYFADWTVDELNKVKSQRCLASAN